LNAIFFDENRFNWKDNWYNKSILVILSIITVFIAILLLSFKDLLVKNRKIHGFVRTIFLLWILVWLGWIAGGQVSIIHLAALLQALYDGNGFASFLAEPAIVVIGLAALISMPIWGRALFCGWLCPFGALQELLNKLPHPWIFIEDCHHNSYNLMKYFHLELLCHMGKYHIPIHH